MRYSFHCQSEGMNAAQTSFPMIDLNFKENLLPTVKYIRQVVNENEIFDGIATTLFRFSGRMILRYKI